MNYTSLLKQIEQYANRTDSFFIDQIPNFIEQGVSRIYSEAKNIGFEIVENDKILQDHFTLRKPINWKETISFEIYNDSKTITKFLLPRSYEFCKSYWPNNTKTNLPKFYADFDAYTKFLITPTANQDFRYRLIYLGLPLFNEENPTNFLTERYPRLLLYAALSESIPFLKDDTRVATIDTFYNSALQNVNQDAAKLYSDRTSTREKD